jgi:nucleoside-diphosphate-sugar epimerase
MTILTAGGSFAEVYSKKFDAEIVSIREVGEDVFVQKLSKATTIIHNAATIAVADMEQALTRNFDFTRFIVKKLAELNPNAHLIFLSSMSILSPVNSEAYDDALAMTPYAYSKYLAETYCLKSSLQHVSCVRFSTLFFRDPQKDGLSKMVREAAINGKITTYNGGEALRNFLPIGVAAKYVNKVAQLKESQKQTYNLAAPHPTSFADTAAWLQEFAPELVHEDITVPAPKIPVLANFNRTDIDSLGEIQFSLKDEVTAYLESLRK